MTALTLYELNRLIRDTLLLTLPEELWVTAEIAEFRQGARGHCYMEFVEKEDCSAGQFRAKARGNIWQNVATVLLPKFEHATGRPLQEGLKVLIKVKVGFHEVYGYSLNVIDIDPVYTLGDMARRRQEILALLEEDGVLSLNRELALPRLLRRIAIVSAAGAAGFGDFSHQLEQSGFKFTTHLFEASMQGAEVEAGVISALNRIAGQPDLWDCVVIIRGGGAVSDLNGFETYLLAANVAQFPLPILTGIGHERDETVIDLVAHKRFKTPTAVAEFLIRTRTEEWEALRRLETRLLNATTLLLNHKQMVFERIATRYQTTAQDFIHRQNERLRIISNRLQLCTQERLMTGQNQLDSLPLRLQNATQSLLLRHKHRFEKWEAALNMADPQRIINLGYSLTLDENGKVVRSAAFLPIGSTIHTQLAEGRLTSRVIAKD